MTDDHDLDWLAAGRPRTALLPRTTAAARTALLAHVDGRRVVSRRPVPAARRAAARRWAWPARVLALAAATAAVLAAVGTGRHGEGVPGAFAPASAQAAPLVRLAARVRLSPAPPGDATLVLRLQAYPYAAPIAGADLYADDGRYFYAPKATGLPAQVEANATADGGFIHREVEAAAAAATLPPAEARARMLHVLVPKPQHAEPTSGSAAAQLAEKRRAEAAARAKTGSSWVADQATLDDGYVWGGALDALIAGAGRPDVRAGVLRLLATIRAVTVAHRTDGGRDVLDVRADGLQSPSYREELVLDAGTGTPLRFVGGDRGKTPSVVVTYTVERVSLAAVRRGRTP